MLTVWGDRTGGSPLHILTGYEAQASRREYEPEGPQMLEGTVHGTSAAEISEV